MRDRSGFGWLALIVSILLVLLGIATFIWPEAALESFVMVYGVLAVATGKNWRLINDENSEGNKKQGWMNVAYMVGYVLIAVTVISFCVGKIAGVSFSI